MNEIIEMLRDLQSYENEEDIRKCLARMRSLSYKLIDNQSWDVKHNNVISIMMDYAIEYFEVIIPDIQNLQQIVSKEVKD